MWARQKAEHALEAAEMAAGFARDRGCRMGSGRLSLAVAVGRSADVPVVWSTPIPGLYSVEPVAGSGLIGVATLAVRSQSPAGCVITVTAQGVAVAVGAVVLAHATF